MGLSRPLVWFFTFSWFILLLQLINFILANDDRKEERRRKSMLHSINRKMPTPSENRYDSNFELKKAFLHPEIRTRPAQTDCHCSTTCATTTSAVSWFNMNYFLTPPARPGSPLLEPDHPVRFTRATSQLVLLKKIRPVLVVLK